MEKVLLGENLKLSRFIHGQWRLSDWSYTSKEYVYFLQSLLERGISSFDHADIYGDYTCENLFGEAIRLNPSLRLKMQYITKCGIKLLSDKFPDRKVKSYDYSSEHILYSVEQSLKRLGTDYIDLLLLHRPSPFFSLEEVCKVFSQLKDSGKVLHFGLSNFLPVDTEALQEMLDFPIVCNQLELSPYCLEHFDNGNLNYMQSRGIKPMAWSPLGGGQFLNQPPEDDLHLRLKELGLRHGEESLTKILLAWLLLHPADVLPVLGTGRLERIDEAISSLDIELSMEEWFEIYTAAKGSEVP